MTIKWCHFSDTHIGYRQYGLLERFNDFAASAKTCTELIIEKKPDFVLFSGDLFENYRPLPSDYRVAYEILEEFRKNSIPLYAIRGNHDASYASSKRYGGHVLDFFQDIGLINLIEDEVKIVKKGEKEIALIAGLGFCGKRTQENLKELLESNSSILKKKDIPKILMLHAFVEGMVSELREDLNRYTCNQLDFDYIALGHYHVQWPADFKAPKNKLFCPGSTEHWSANEWVEQVNGIRKGLHKGFFYVETNKESSNWVINPEFITYNVRPKIYLTHNFKKTNAKEVLEKIGTIIKEFDLPKHILKINVKGTLLRGELTLLNLNDLKKMAKNVLYFDLVTQFADASIDVKQGLTVREAIIDVLNKQFELKNSDLDENVSLIEDMLSIVDEKDFEDKGINRIEKFIPKVTGILKYEDKESKNNVLNKKIKRKSKSKSKKKTKSLEDFE